MLREPTRYIDHLLYTACTLIGTFKLSQRRRSMLPKLASGEEGSELSEGHEGHSSQVDVSMEATDADSSMKSIDNGDLPPLEKARRRRLLLSARA